MRLEFHPMQQGWAREVASWRYGGELSFYDGSGDEAEFMNGSYLAALDDGELIGFFVTGESARVPGYRYDEGCTDVGLGMRPDRVRRGLGREFVRQGLRIAVGSGDARMTVASFNRPAMKVYSALGFEVEGAFLARSGARFYVMVRRRREWIDISRELHPDMQVYPGDAPFQMESRATAVYRASSMRMSVHAGTHVDAPAHFLFDATADALDLSALNGPAAVGEIDHLYDFKPGFGRYLIKTDRGFDTSEAEWLLSLNARLVGVTRLSVAPYECEAPVHRMLLGAGVVVLENICLDGVQDGLYELHCLPLRISGADGAPARAVLRRICGLCWGEGF